MSNIEFKISILDIVDEDCAKEHYDISHTRTNMYTTLFISYNNFAESGLIDFEFSHEMDILCVHLFLAKHYGFFLAPVKTLLISLASHEETISKNRILRRIRFQLEF